MASTDFLENLHNEICDIIEAKFPLVKTIFKVHQAHAFNWAKVIERYNNNDNPEFNVPWMVAIYDKNIPANIGMGNISYFIPVTLIYIEKEFPITINVTTGTPSGLNYSYSTQTTGVLVGDRFNFNGTEAKVLHVNPLILDKNVTGEGLITDVTSFVSSRLYKLRSLMYKNAHSYFQLLQAPEVDAGDSDTNNMLDFRKAGLYTGQISFKALVQDLGGEIGEES